MRFYSPARHLELRRYLGVIASLQKQFDDLLFARAQTDGLLQPAVSRHRGSLVLHSSTHALYSPQIKCFPMDVAPGMPF